MFNTASVGHRPRMEFHKTQMCTALAFIFILKFTVLFNEPVSAASSNEHSRSLNFYVHYNSDIQGATPLASSTVIDKLSCMFFCLRKHECWTASLSKTTNSEGEFQCIAYGVHLGTMGTNLVASNVLDLYVSTDEVPHTCTHIRYQGFQDSKMYTIDPDGPNGHAQPFSVFCDMTSHGGVGVTVVTHDSEARTLVDGCEPSGCYTRRVKYDGISDVSQLRALTEASPKCEQFIRYECKGAMLFEPHLYGLGAAWFESREGLNMTYLGRAPRNSGQCENGACICDNNNVEVWQEDSGMFSYKEDLPVMALRFGDVGSSIEQAYHTLGRLKCYGNLND